MQLWCVCDYVMEGVALSLPIRSLENSLWKRRYRVNRTAYPIQGYEYQLLGKRHINDLITRVGIGGFRGQSLCKSLFQILGLFIRLGVCLRNILQQIRCNSRGREFECIDVPNGSLGFLKSFWLWFWICVMCSCVAHGINLAALPIR